MDQIKQYWKGPGEKDRQGITGRTDQILKETVKIKQSKRSLDGMRWTKYVEMDPSKRNKMRSNKMRKGERDKIE